MFLLEYNPDDVKDYRIETDIKYLEKPDFMCVVGSRLYGTYDEQSDYDVRGFAFLPKEYLLGIKKFEQHETLVGKDDTVIWSAENFVRMLLKGSSCAFEVLFCPERHILCESEYAKRLRALKFKFVTKKYFAACYGYAIHEWRKATGEITRDLGEKRKNDIKAFGYSCKNAYHAIRILDMAIDLYETGDIEFPRNIAHVLRAIKTGYTSFELTEGMYNRLLRKLDDILKGMPKSKYDIYEINTVLCDINHERLVTDMCYSEGLHIT